MPKSEFLPLCVLPPTLFAPKPVLVGCIGVIMPMPIDGGRAGVRVLFIDPILFPIPNPPLLLLLLLLLLLWNPLLYPPMPPDAIPVELLLADWNPPNEDVDVERLPSVCDRGGVPAGFCWGWEKGGRDPEKLDEEAGVVIGLSGGIENEEVAAVGVKVLLLIDVLLLVVWKLDEDVGVMGRDPNPPMLLELESDDVAPNMLGVAGFKTGVVEPKDMGLVAIFGSEAAYLTK